MLNKLRCLQIGYGVENINQSESIECAKSGIAATVN